MLKVALTVLFLVTKATAVPATPVQCFTVTMLAGTSVSRDLPTTQAMQLWCFPHADKETMGSGVSWGK